MDKLTQKVSNLLDEIGDVNILVRRMTPTQETLNRINERVDAVFVVLKQLENGVQLDEKKLAQLEEQIALLKDWLESVRKMAEDLLCSFTFTAGELKASVQGLEVKGGQLGELVKDLGSRIDGIRKGQDTRNLEEYSRWENNNKVLRELQKRLVDLRVKEIILIVLVLMVLSILLIRR